MAGLLDALNSRDGIFALGLLQAAAPQPVRQSLGGGLLSALGQASAWQNQQDDRAASKAEREQRAQMLALQMQQLQAQQAAQQAAQQRRQQYLGGLDPNNGPPMQATLPGAMAAGFSPQEAAALMPQGARAPEYKVVGGSLVQIGPNGVSEAYRAPEAAQKPPTEWQLYELSGAKQRGVGFDQWDAARRRAGAASVNVSTGERGIPYQLMKQQDELIDRMTTAQAIDADLGAVEKTIGQGGLKFGPIRNLVNTAKNVAGASDDESRAFGTFKSTLEKLRNDSLRLNNGVQTEGDAQRAWNELFQNINDTDLVKQRLGDIRRINQRAASLQAYRLNTLRANSGAAPLPLPDVQPAISGESGAKAGKAPLVGQVVDGYRYKGGDPADRASWEQAR